MRRTISVVSAVVLAMSGLAVGPGTATATEPGTGTGRVLSVAVDPGPFAVDGYAGQAQSTITAVIDEPRGTIDANPGEDWPHQGVVAEFRRTPGGPGDLENVDLAPVSKSGSVQTFSGRWLIGSARVGTWTLVGLYWTVASRYEGADPRVSPGVTLTITVVGTNVPTSTVSLIPPVVPFGARQVARYTFRTSTGDPIVGATVLWRWYTGCPDPVSPPPVGYAVLDCLGLRTNNLGQVTLRLDDKMNVPKVLRLWGPPAVAGDPSTQALLFHLYVDGREYYKWVSAAPSTTSVRIGRSLTVTGSVNRDWPGGDGVVRLQRLIGRTWHTIASAIVHPTSARYSVVAPVTTLGRSYYRVVALGAFSYLAPTPSRVFQVTGTRR